jgi:hypothetical protein
VPDFVFRFATHALCRDCGARRLLTGSRDIERHTRRVKGLPHRIRCDGTGRKPKGWRA